MRYIPRKIGSKFRNALESFPAVLLTGPRQSGKTTFLREEFGGQYTIRYLDEPQTRLFASEDPVGFFESNPPPLILDEIQYLPQLLPYIKRRIDDNRKPGQWILTGSQQFQLMQNITESLAGRIAILNLLPFSLSEIFQVHPDLPLENWIFKGGYPEVVVNPKVSLTLWMNGYLQTYLERDVRNIRQIGDLQQFQRFLKHTAARSSQLLNYSDISRDLGISVPTVKQWVSVLQASHIVYLVPPYYRNLGKRQIKSPKLYFLDTGLMASLLEYQNGREILNGPMAGAFFETAVVSELIKNFFNNARQPALYYWRTRTGQEMDVVIETNGKLILIEIKLTASPTNIHIDKINKVREVFAPERVEKSFLVCTVPETTPLPQNIKAIPWKELATFIL